MPSPTLRLRPDLTRARHRLALAMAGIVVVLILGNGVPVQAMAMPHPVHHCPHLQVVVPSAAISTLPGGAQQRQHTAPGTASGETCHHQEASPSIAMPSVIRPETPSRPLPAWTSAVEDATSHSPELPPPRA